MLPIGIDLGTTSSVIAYFDGKKPVVIPNMFHRTRTPSKVIISPEGKFYVGEKAESYVGKYEADNFTVGSIKRLIGRKSQIIYGGKKHYPQVILAMIFADLKRQAEKFLKQKIDTAVVCIPCNYGVLQRQATLEAAEMAGLKVIRILNEATAAALAYNFLSGFEFQGEELIFDLGGGTLDISVIDYGEGVLAVKGVEGNDMLGGDDFDEKIIEYIVEYAKKTHNFDPIEDQMFGWGNVARLRIAETAEKAKKDFSQATSAKIYLPYIRNILGKFEHIDFEFDYNIFERICAPLTNDILKTFETAVKEFLLAKARIVFTGGGSKIKCVKDAILNKYHNFTYITREKELVALGAALQAAIMSGQCNNILLLDVTARSIGIALKDNKYKKIIPKNTTLPTQKSDIFTTTVDDQRNLSVMIYEGENEKANKNNLLVEYEFGPLPQAKAGELNVKIIFDMDANNILHISVKEQTRRQTISMTRKGSPYSNMDSMIKNSVQAILERYVNN
ncbi:MAG: Hsp70 family protein [Candidatus Omnitrophica bacterium]|nr:Hsp70 family protein [Candidatus Omnitrophota bacterium]MBU4478471.1 Hsp70 family protein [Candidatus Omnitrophota bacterium]MCG2703772.1 Hsp70 family protein [Candidatus Omnitrophota bacterium]